MGWGGHWSVVGKSEGITHHVVTLLTRTLRDTGDSLASGQMLSFCHGCTQTKGRAHLSKVAHEPVYVDSHMDCPA